MQSGCGETPGFGEVLNRLLEPCGVAMRLADVPGHAHDATRDARLGEDVPRLDERANGIFWAAENQVRQAQVLQRRGLAYPVPFLAFEQERASELLAGLIRLGQIEVGEAELDPHPRLGPSVAAG